MHSKYLFRISLLLLLISCSCFYGEIPVKLEYPDTFTAIEYNENTVFLSLPNLYSKRDVYLAVDTGTREIQAEYEFPLSDKLYTVYSFIQVNNRVIMNLVNEFLGDMVILDLSSGKLKRLPSNYDQVVSFALSGNDLYYPGDVPEATDRHILWIYNLTDASYRKIETKGYIANSVYGLPQSFTNNGKSYIVLNDFVSGSPLVLNVETNKLIDIMDASGLSIEAISLDSPDYSTSANTEYFLLLTFDGNSGDQILCRFTGFEPVNCEVLMTVSSGLTSARIVLESDTSLIIETSNGPQDHRFLIYDLNEKKVIQEIAKYPDGNEFRCRGNIVYKNNCFWWIYYNCSEERMYLVRMDALNYEQELIKVDEKWQID